MSEPKSIEHFQELFQVFDVRWFHQERICAVTIGLLYVAHFVGRRQNDHGHLRARGELSDPMQQFDSVYLRHFKISQDNGWEWKFRTIGILTLAFEIGHRLRAVLNVLKATIDAGLLKRAFQKLRVILIVLCI